MEAGREAFGGRAAAQLPALNARVSDMLRMQLEEVAGLKVLRASQVRRKRDERIAGDRGQLARVAATAESAARLGLHPHENFAA